VQRTLIVELRDGALSGYGEATANPHYYGVSIEGMIAALEALRPQIESAVIDSPEAFWARMEPFLREHPFALCALDVAVNDLFARQRGMPLYQYWGLSLESIPMSNYTIGIASIEEMVAKMEEQPWPLYKIKLGTPNDLEIIRELRRHTDAVFRVDANCAWTPEQTIAFAPDLKALGVEFIEQPLKAEDWEGMRQVFEQCVLPVMADESCRVEAD
jgi:L-alanine-DL-glutamate epimerase-like enolase superfamily enzyme